MWADADGIIQLDLCFIFKCILIRICKQITQQFLFLFSTLFVRFIKIDSILSNRVTHSVIKQHQMIEEKKLKSK